MTTCWKCGREMPADAAPTDRECDACETGFPTAREQDAALSFINGKFKFYQVKWEEIQDFDDLKLVLSHFWGNLMTDPKREIPPAVLKYLREVQPPEKGDQP
jgi:hypothetical protein